MFTFKRLFPPMFIPKANLLLVANYFQSTLFKLQFQVTNHIWKINTIIMKAKNFHSEKNDSHQNPGVSAKETTLNPGKEWRVFRLLPNIVTLTGLFAGCVAIEAAIKGHLEKAIMAIWVAMVLDFIDGFVARLLNIQSTFGAELDSLCDMVSFGVAPVLVTYINSLTHLPMFGGLASFMYVTASALRLARFNIQSETTDKRYFQGLPVPAAAALLSSSVWAITGWSDTLSTPIVKYFMTFLTVLIAILMVSNIRYHSLKQLDLAGRLPFLIILLIVLLVLCFLVNIPKIIFLIFMGYMLSGIVFYAVSVLF